MSKLSQVIYERYLSGTCTKEEELLVLQYFNEFPEELEAYMDETSWEKFEQYPLRSQQDVRKTLAAVQQRIRRRKITVIRILTATAAAASILLAVLLIQPAEKTKPTQAIATAAPEYIIWENKNTTPETRILEDGSKVTLQPHAILRYGNKFSVRTIWLTGDARFWVAKDSNRPFSVISREIVTTAIGTSFSVQTIKQHLHVRLFEGKVSIHKMNDNNEIVYLQPGEELTYNKSFKVLKKETTKPVVETYALDEGTDFKYKRAPLQKALALLSAWYKVPITADNKSIANIYLTAEFDKTDKLITILQTIATLNDLNLKGNDQEGYHLSN
ncbi:DUF4974 domain-containing protein [Chitinophaga sp. SYP-B3965]|uniref:FecR family protein n=1 Tax=Chitinophaga sp. SYP-B3965 TaxID=2663120 RepID=UPI001299AFE4|nr:FecR domain-containing protein [Chitinophaga sp. SYP-B3965]MRG47920.1 DUF4974 domain-containing protein [Chitinophaga sp. SYP-B3965]